MAGVASRECRLASGLRCGSICRVPGAPVFGFGQPFVSCRVVPVVHPIALRFVREGRFCRQPIISWMFLGFETLMMAPLRVEYLATPRYGVHVHGNVLTPGMVALITGVSQNVARLVLNPIWGWLFDRMNFFVLRITLNFGFMLGILSFFTTGSLIGLVTGAILFGLSNP